LTLSVAVVCLFLLDPFLKNGNLHLLLIDLVAEEDDFLLFVVGVHFRQAFQASFAGSSGESGGKNRSFNDQCNRGVDNLDIVCHNLVLNLR